MTEKYQWIDFYGAFAAKLSHYQNHKDELFNQMKSLEAKHQLFHFLHFDREDWWGHRNNHIDPFTVMAVMNRGLTDENRTAVGKIYAETFDIDIPIPTEFAGIPVVNNMSSFFADENNTMWQLFNSAIDYADKNENHEVFCNYFDRALKIAGNGLSRITMGLFWIRPDTFMPLDRNSKDYVTNKYQIKIPHDGLSYINFLEELDQVRNNTPLYEISYNAWTEISHENKTEYKGSMKTKQQNTKENDYYNHAKNLILFGPPGTGKTYSSILHAVSIVEQKNLYDIISEDYSNVSVRFKKYKSQNLINFITFHQSYSYEEFIEGIRPVVSANQGENNQIEYEIVDGVFKAFVESKPSLNSNPKKNRVFIIDEINRGNISKIFGELITLIEASKRLNEKEAIESILPYSKQSFGIPNNIYIIGTMNTADRSIALIDTALRRRFDFEEMEANPKLLKGIDINGINIEKLLTIMNQRITVLLDRNHAIGHAYFLPLKEDATIEKLGRIFKDNIIPLLQEYFYDDYEKIQLVLGDNQKDNEINKFIFEDNQSNILFGNTDYYFRKYYKINDSVFNKVEAYEFL